MNNSKDLANSNNFEIGLRDILIAIHRRIYIALSCASLILLLGFIYAIFATPQYTSHVIVRPLPEEGNGLLSGLGGNLASAATLAGINLGSGGSDREEYLAILQSRRIAEIFFREQDALPQLFPDRWDETMRTWRPVEVGLLGRLKRSLIPTPDHLKESSDRPSNWLAFEEFKDIRGVAEDPATGIVTVSFTHQDARLAARWANQFVALVNREIRADRLAESERALEYLSVAVQETSLAGLRETIFRLVEKQHENIMLAQARTEFAFKVIDPAVVAEQPSHPQRALIVMLALLLGSMFGVFAALIWDGYRSMTSHDAVLAPSDQPAP